MDIDRSIRAIKAQERIIHREQSRLDSLKDEHFNNLLCKWKTYGPPSIHIPTKWPKLLKYYFRKVWDILENGR